MYEEKNERYIKILIVSTIIILVNMFVIQSLERLILLGKFHLEIGTPISGNTIIFMGGIDAEEFNKSPYQLVEEKIRTGRL